MKTATNGNPLITISFFCKKCGKNTNHIIQIKKSMELKIDSERLIIIVRWCNVCQTRIFQVFTSKEWDIVKLRKL